MCDSEKNESQNNVHNPIILEPRNSDDRDFDATDAVRLFNRRIETALEKQRVAIVSKIQEKFQYKSADSCDLQSEGNKIQFKFNEERLRALDLIEKKLSINDIGEIFVIINKEIEALHHRNKILRIADKHGWDTVKEYTDSDLADNPEDASKLRAAISRAAAKKRRYLPYSKEPQSTKPGIFDGLTPRQLFRGNAGFQQYTGYNQKYNNRANPSYFRPNYQVPGNNVICLYCQLPGHFAKFCPYTDLQQRVRPIRVPEATATSDSTEPRKQ
ncbi:uncharacterized protein LOC134262208 [Saccostrea cucullata]|uniref:uncharacterized protein LOC134262208 n=1 Tax=Saccostrea cuccullata TaxID=36930 RepID=UPI002ED0F668